MFVLNVALNLRNAAEWTLIPSTARVSMAVPLKFQELATPFDNGVALLCSLFY